MAAGGHWAGRRSVCPGSHPLRNADGPAAVQGNQHPGHPGAGPQPGTSAARPLAARRAARPGNDLSEMSCQGAGPALRQRGRPGRRPETLPQGRADPGPAGAVLGACRQMGSPPAGPGGPAGQQQRGPARPRLRGSGRRSLRPARGAAANPLPPRPRHGPRPAVPGPAGGGPGSLVPRPGTAAPGAGADQRLRSAPGPEGNRPAAAGPSPDAPGREAGPPGGPVLSFAGAPIGSGVPRPLQ